ncbi:MAG: hypothetical protein IPM74_06295 [Crocinitomicaceae bacterium]|nr:hypothetical protein [Crocinitomicaceae bacterium]MBK8925515.1 hypothetical protein [Crocinitomicaceae bacterium]
MTMRYLVFVVLVINLLSCSGDGDKGKLLAVVGDEELYQADLNHLFTRSRYSYDDSIALVKTYTQNWVEEQILVQQAEETEEIDQDIIDVRVKNFRNDLLIHELENQLLSERLDTHVTSEEIQTYYLNNQKEFQLNDYLVKVLYLKVTPDAPDLEKVGQWYKLAKPADIDEISAYAKVYASNFYYDINNWIYFDDLLKEVPLQDINKDKFILKRSKIRFEEGGYYYFLNIIDYKLKNSISPLSFERENIKERIMNIRVRDLREEIKTEIINQAYAENKVQIY